MVRRRGYRAERPVGAGPCARPNDAKPRVSCTTHGRTPVSARLTWNAITNAAHRMRGGHPQGGAPTMRVPVPRTTVPHPHPIYLISWCLCVLVVALSVFVGRPAGCLYIVLSSGGETKVQSGEIVVDRVGTVVVNVDGHPTRSGKSGEREFGARRRAVPYLRPKRERSARGGCRAPGRVNAISGDCLITF